MHVRRALWPGDRVDAPHTRLVCTVGPATIDRVGDLVAAGMDVARINLSHGSPEQHATSVSRVRDAAAIPDEPRQAGAEGPPRRPVGVLIDLQGPKVRLGPLRDGAVELVTGARFLLRKGDAEGDAQAASTTHLGLASDLRPGDRVLLSDGAAELRVVAVGEDVDTEIVRGGRIRSGAGVNVPAERLSLPAITDRDRLDARRAVDLGADIVAQSFVRRASDVVELRGLLGDRPPMIMAKLETRAAIDDLDAILEAADAIMVARGDLGVEIPFEHVPIVQKEIIRAARARGRPVVVATQMLESMTGAPRPTRAEASDVANAVFDGADGVLLSAETAIGRYPIEAADAAVRICRAAEAAAERWAGPSPP